jgi:AMP phosphorylase
LTEFFVKKIGIEMGNNEVVLNSEAAIQMDLSVMDRVRLTSQSNSVVAIVNTTNSFVSKNQVGLFEDVSKMLGATEGQAVTLERASRPASLDYIRKKLDGGVLSANEISAIISDLMVQNLSSAELAAFVSAVYTKGLSTDETAALTESIIASGEVITPPHEPAVSEHSIGGVAGGRSSILAVPILTSLGFCVPKTASRAISSASATADVMEVLCPVALSSSKIMQVLREAGGCIAWGGGVNIAAADDKLIQIRNPLHLDPQPLLVASIMAKKKAEGAKFVVLDIPVGRGVKVDTLEEGRNLARAFEVFSARLGISVSCMISDGSQPLCDELGPTFEARQVLIALSSKGQAGSRRMIQKACAEAGVILHMVRGITREEGFNIAMQQVESGKAYEALQKIIAAQGGNPDVLPEDLPVGQYKRSFFASEEGTVSHIDNKSVSRIMRAMGAPKDKQAGMVLHVQKGQPVISGQEMFQLFATSEEALKQGAESVRLGPLLVEVDKVVLDVV